MNGIGDYRTALNQLQSNNNNNINNFNVGILDLAFYFAFFYIE